MLYATDKVRPIGAEREQSCGCDTVRYAVTASVSGMLAEETAEVVIAHTLACLLDVFFPPRWCGCYIGAGTLDMNASVKNTKHAENVEDVKRS